MKEQGWKIMAVVNLHTLLSGDLLIPVCLCYSPWKEE